MKRATRAPLHLAALTALTLPAGPTLAQSAVTIAGVADSAARSVSNQGLGSSLAGRVGTTNVDANDALQLGVGYVYNLSKRSALHATYARIDNDGAATFVVPGGPAGIAGGKLSSGYELGMRHNF